MGDERSADLSASGQTGALMRGRAPTDDVPEEHRSGRRRKQTHAHSQSPAARRDRPDRDHHPAATEHGGTGRGHVLIGPTRLRAALANVSPAANQAGRRRDIAILDQALRRVGTARVTIDPQFVRVLDTPERARWTPRRSAGCSRTGAKLAA